MEEIDGAPEQLFEVGFEPRVFEHPGERIDDAGRARCTDLLVGQRARVGLVLVRTVAVHLQFEDDAAVGEDAW